MAAHKKRFVYLGGTAVRTEDGVVTKGQEFDATLSWVRVHRILFAQGKCMSVEDYKAKLKAEEPKPAPKLEEVKKEGDKDGKEGKPKKRRVEKPKKDKGKD